jgi:peptidoglycan hydrolase-like protein with peptidoglycan-binding domain
MTSARGRDRFEPTVRPDPEPIAIAKPVPVVSLLHGLQQTAGNRAVTRALARAVATAPLLRRGSSGEGVRSVQERLNLLGATPALTVDGSFGPLTDKAVRFFQAAHRLVVDGIVGPETNPMLDREVSQHGDAEDALARRGGPCHTPEEPGPDDAATGEALDRPPPVLEEPAFAFTELDTRRGSLKAKDEPTQPKGPPSPPADLVVQLTDEAPPGPGQDDTQVSQALAQANAGGATPVKVASPEELRELLKKKGAVGRLIIISHGLNSGEVRFDLQGTRDVKLADLAAELAKSGATVEQVVFRGCSIGNDRTGLEEVRKSVKASVAEGTNCHLESKRAGPVTIVEPPVGKNKPRQVVIDSEAKFKALHPNDKPVYHRTLRNLLNSAGHQDCLVGLPQGKTAASLSDDELRAIAMRNRGRLVVQYTKESDQCFTDLQFGGTGQCRRIQAVAPTKP